jgi:hypothetical protein
MSRRPTDDEREDARREDAEGRRPAYRRGPQCEACGERHPVREDCSGCDDHLAAEAETDDEC